MSTKNPTEDPNAIWNDDAFGSRLDTDVQKAQDEARRKRYGGDDTPDIGFTRLASDAPMSLRNALTRMLNSNDREVQQMLKQDGVEIEGNTTITLHRPDGRAIVVSIFRHEKGGWAANIPVGREWRMAIAPTRERLIEFLAKVAGQAPRPSGN